MAASDPTSAGGVARFEVEKLAAKGEGPVLLTSTLGSDTPLLQCSQAYRIGSTLLSYIYLAAPLTTSTRPRLPNTQ